MFRLLTLFVFITACGPQDKDEGSNGYPIVSVPGAPCSPCSRKEEPKSNNLATNEQQDERESRVLTEPEEKKPTPVVEEPTEEAPSEPSEPINLPPLPFESLSIAVTGDGKVNSTSLECSGETTDPEGDRIYYETFWEKSYDGENWEALPFEVSQTSIDITYDSGLFLQRPMIRCHKTAWDVKEQNRDEIRAATSDVFAVVNSAPTVEFAPFKSFIGLTNDLYPIVSSPRTGIVLNAFFDADGDGAQFASSVGGGCEDTVTTTFGWFTDTQNRTYSRLTATYTGPMAGEIAPFYQECHANLFVSDGIEEVFGGQYPIQVRGL